MSSMFTGTMRPTNASCAWSTGCDYWRTSATDYQIVDLHLTLLHGPIDSASLAITGGWLTGKVGFYCVDTDPYVTVVNAKLLTIDVWQALNDGEWSSSVVFTIHARKKAGVGSGNLQVGPDSPGPIQQYKTIYDVLDPPACPTSAGTTVTIYDDGTFTLA